jgi:hypothetical protein
VTQSTADGTNLVPISASQLTTFATCRRLWAFEKLDGLGRAETNAINDGTAIHNEVELYFKVGTAPQRPEARALLGLCPPRVDSLIPEAEFILAWPGEAALLRGRIDLVDPVNHVVYDHKTTSNIDRYAKSEEELRLDAQPIVYGLAYRAVFHNTHEVVMQWNYVKREQPRNRPPQTKAVRLTQDLRMLQEGLEKWQPVVADLVQISRRRGRALDVLPSPGEACFKYGGCPYRDACPDYAGNQKQKEVVPVNPAVLAKLAALSSSTPAPLPEPRFEPEAALPPEVRQIAPIPTAPVAPTMPLLDSVRIALDIKPDVVPPDAQPDVSPIDPPPPPVVETKKGRGRPKKTATVVDEPSVSTTVDEPTTFAFSSPPASDLTTSRALIQSVIDQAANGTLDQRIEAAKLALQLIHLDLVLKT